MKKLNHIILVPVFNDWKSFNRLTFEIEKKFKFLKGYNNQILVINDKSTIKKKIKKKHFKNISNIKTLDLKKNCGSQSYCNRFILSKKNKKKFYYNSHGWRWRRSASRDNKDVEVIKKV